MTSSGIESPDDVHFVQVKGPAFTTDDIVAASNAGQPSATQDPGKLMGFGRAASALGVAKALGEISANEAQESAVLHNFDAYSSVASVSAGVEVRANEVIVAGLSRMWSGPLTIAHRAIKDALDIVSVTALARDLGLSPAPQVSAAPGNRCDRRQTARHTCARLRARADRDPSSRPRSWRAR